MKRNYRIISAVLALVMTCSLEVHALSPAPEEKVSILFTHDIHSRLEEYKTVDENGDTVFVGGFSRLKTAIDQVREENPATLVVDAGDFSMGTLYQTVYENEASELTMLGRLGVDATTFGNHEFDFRSEGVSNMFHAALQNAEEDTSLKLPQFLEASIDWEKNQSDENKVVWNALEDYGSTEYTVIEKGGYRIGIYGIMGEDSAQCAPESGLVFEDIVETSKRVVKELEKEDVDMIVCLSHSGSSDNPKKSEDEILAKEVPEIDVIISGHSHTSLEEPIIYDHTVIASAGNYGKYLGELELVPSEDGRWELESYELNLMDETVEKDEEIERYLEEYKAAINEEYLSGFGYTLDQVLVNNQVTFTPIDEFGEVQKEDPLGSIIADSYIYAIEQAEGEDYEKVDLAVCPMGVVRDSLPKGDLTVSDVFNVSALGIGADRISGYPLVSVYLTGKELKTVAEIDASVSTLMNYAQLYPSGMKWTYNPNRLILNRVTDVRFSDDSEIEDEKLYRVVAGLYTAQMLGAVESQSKGILKVIPKDKNGTPITDFEQHIIYNQSGQELKEWYALASYLESFSIHGNGQIPEDEYAEASGRKIIQDTTNLVELLKKPNKIACVIYFAGIAVILLIVGISLLCYNKVRKRNRRKA